MRLIPGLIFLCVILVCPLAASDHQQFSGKLGFAHGVSGSSNPAAPHFNGHVLYEVLEHLYVGGLVGIGVPGPTTLLIGAVSSYELPFINLDLVAVYRAVSKGSGNYFYSFVISPGLTMRVVELTNTDGKTDGLYCSVSKAVLNLTQEAEYSSFPIPSLGMNLEVGYFIGF